MFDTHPTRTMPHHSANALASADFAKTQTHSAKTALFHRFSPNWSALWRPNPVKSRLRRHQSGGIALQEGATRRRHAVRGLRVVQNPRRPPVWRVLEGPEGLAAVLMSGGRAWLRCPWAVVGPGRVPRRNDETTARQISHAIPPRHDPAQAQKPQNINDQISKPEILSGELHAKLMGERPVGPQAARPTHQQAMQRPEHPWGRKQPGTHTAHTARGPKRRSASGPSRASVAHRLSWMLRPGTASISSRV